MDHELSLAFDRDQVLVEPRLYRQSHGLRFATDALEVCRPYKLCCLSSIRRTPVCNQQSDFNKVLYFRVARSQNCPFVRGSRAQLMFHKARDQTMLVDSCGSLAEVRLVGL